MSKKVIAGVVGDVTAYAYAKAGGYTGTEEEFQALMAANVEAAKYADEVRAAAAAANEDKEAAAESKDAAAASASAAAASQADAATSKAAAETAANYARTYTGAPRVAATAAAMTDQSLIYVYTGSETGYTAGNWYFWDGTTWTSGGVYNSTALETDETLTVSGAAADAKVTGDEIGALKIALDTFEESVESAYKQLGDFEKIEMDFSQFGSDTQGTPRYTYNGTATTKKGKLQTIQLVAATSGAGEIIVAEPFGTNYFHKIVEISVTCTEGYNVFSNGIDFSDDTIIPVGSIIGFKSDAAKLYISATVTPGFQNANEYFSRSEATNFGISLSASLFITDYTAISDEIVSTLSPLIMRTEKTTLSTDASSSLVIQCHDGSVAVVSGFGSVEIPVIPGEKYYVSGYFDGNVGVAFLDGKTYRSGLNKDTLGKYATDVEITVPSNAYNMAVSTRDITNYPVVIKSETPVYYSAEYATGEIKNTQAQVNQKQDALAKYGSTISGTPSSGAKNYTTGATLDSENYNYLTITSGFTPGNDIGVSGYKIDNANYPLCYFEDSSGNRFGAVSPASGGYYRQIVNVPYNAAKIIINGTSATNPNNQYQPACCAVTYTQDDFVKTCWEDQNYIAELQKEYHFATPDHAVVVFVFDDTLPDVSDMVDLFADNEVPINLATIPNNLIANICDDGNVALDVVKRAVANGGEVLCHSQAYIDASSTDADFEQYFVGLKKELVNKYGFEVKGIVRAGGYSTEPDADKCVRYLSSYYEYGTGFTSIRSASRYGILTRNSLTESVSTIKGKIDAIASGGIICYYGHGKTELGNDWVTKMQEIITYVKSITNAEIVTYGEVFTKYLRTSFMN